MLCTLSLWYKSGGRCREMAVLLRAWFWYPWCGLTTSSLISFKPYFLAAEKSIKGGPSPHLPEWTPDIHRGQISNKHVVGGGWHSEFYWSCLQESGWAIIYWRSLGHLAVSGYTIEESASSPPSHHYHQPLGPQGAKSKHTNKQNQKNFYE